MKRAYGMVSAVVFGLLALPTVAMANAPELETFEQSSGTAGDGEHGVLDDQMDEQERLRGWNHAGLRAGRAGTPCEGLLEVADIPSGVACTHGPDPSPIGRRIDSGPTLVTAAEEATATPIWCDSDGVSGARVQAIYAVAADRQDRFEQVRASIEVWAGNVQRTFAQSAAVTGGVRNVRWVTDDQCNLSIRKVVLPPEGDDTFQATITALQAAGFDGADRKYMVWADAEVYCGIGALYFDDRPSQDNYNNGAYAMYARIDSGCWGLDNSVEAHELMHTFGAIQPSAPNSNGTGHCNDEFDRMCYAEGGQSTRNVCPESYEALFDCGNDDYFHTAPPSGSYLATHWNTADSRFLTDQPTSRTPEERELRDRGQLTRLQPARRYELDSAGGTLSITVVGAKKPGRSWTVVVRDANGALVARRGGERGATLEVRDLEAGIYTVAVRKGRGVYNLTAAYHA